jgi:hypothetical protein
MTNAPRRRGGEIVHVAPDSNVAHVPRRLNCMSGSRKWVTYLQGQ